MGALKSFKKYRLGLLRFSFLLLLPHCISQEDSHENATEIVGGVPTEQGEPLEVLPEDLYPTVNKCCPFNWSYENEKCVKSGGGNDTSSEPEQEASYWEAPKTIVTLAKDFHTFNTTEILGDPVVFR